MRIFQSLRLRWSIFEYNFAWPDYVPLLNGRAARVAPLIPFVGYAVLFNDAIAENLNFESLTNNVRTTVFLNPDHRLRWIFMGFMLLATANLLYLFWRPHVLKLGETEEKFIQYYMENATASSFLRLHNTHRQTGFDPLTQEGKYYNDDWELFWREAVWPFRGKNKLQKEDHSATLPGYERVNFVEAKRRHQSVLLSLLRETYFRESRKRRLLLVICMVTALAGYTALVIPSADLCIRVLEILIIGE